MTFTPFGNLGVRARPVSDVPRGHTLVIGVGQVGYQASVALRKMLNATVPPRTRQEYIHSLAIAQRQSIRQEQLLPRENRLLITQDLLNWSDIPGRYAAQGIAKWWPRTPNHPTLPTDPTMARAFGRLLLWTNVEIISDTLYEQVDWLLSASRHSELPCQILLVASLAEAEGSGMVYDVSRRLRHLAQQSEQPIPIVGIFTADAEYSPDDNDAMYTAMAHVYASLKELDAVNLAPQNYPVTFPAAGRTPPNPPQTHEAPLDYICLTGDAQSPTGDPAGKLAEFGMTWILNGIIGGGGDDPLVLLPPHDHSIDAHNRYRGYTLFGVSKLSLPVQATLDYHAVKSAQQALENLLLPNEAPIQEWVRKILNRAHDGFFMQGLYDHPSLIDEMTQLRNRISSHALKDRVEGGIRNREGWQALLQKEWNLLRQQNEPFTYDESGNALPQNVLRRHIDSLLDEALRILMTDLEALALQLAFENGAGLHWTKQVFDTVHHQIDHVLEKINQRRSTTKRAVQAWLHSAESRDLALIHSTGQTALQAFLNDISWQARTAVWESLQHQIGAIVERFSLAINQTPNNIQQLHEQGEFLRQQLQAVQHAPPINTVGAVSNEQWLQDGVRELPDLSRLTRSNLIGTAFQRWNPQHYTALQQIQQFPMDMLGAIRLVLQPHASFANLHDFIDQHRQTTYVHQALQHMAMAAAPQWQIGIVTGKLDDSLPPSTHIELVREAPNAFSSVLPPSNTTIQQRFIGSSDPDELVIIRLTQGIVGEQIYALRHDYRRAYHRIAADNVPLHIDRRWETNMADLVHTPIRSMIADLWETTLRHLQKFGRVDTESLLKLNQGIAEVLNAKPKSLQPIISRQGGVVLFVYALPPFRLKIPPPLCTVVFLVSQNSTAEVEEELFELITENMPEENFFFIVNLVQRGDLAQILDPLRGQSFLPLELTEADIKHIVSAPKPTNALGDLVVGRINLTAVSPFYTRAPVPDHMFFGREREIADVRSKLASHSVVLIGGRRIGKTSTLQKINRALSVSDAPTVPYYLDCSNALKHRHFFRRISREWGVRIAETADPVEFDDVVDQLWDRHADKTPIFLLDEVDRLLKTDQAADMDEPLFRTFRSLSNEKRCQFVFSGEKLLLNSLDNAHSVLFNFPKKVKLSPLRLSVIRRLVTEPFEMLNIWLENSDDLIQQIFNLSAGHPNIVQTICHALVEALDNEKQANLITRKHLGLVLDWHPVQQDIVQTSWGQMDQYARLVTLLWEEDVRQLDFAAIYDMLKTVGLKHLRAQYVKDVVITDLVLYNFLQQNGQYYELIPKLFPTLLDEMTNKPMEIQAILEEARTR